MTKKAIPPVQSCAKEGFRRAHRYRYFWLTWRAGSWIRGWSTLASVSRYADDTLIWSDEYAKVVQAYYWIDECARRMGVPLNSKKSYGISLLSQIGKSWGAELKERSDISWLSYLLNNISISEKRVREIKARITFLAYQNLLQPLKRGIFNDLRLLSGIDLDYVTALQQVRFHLYGGLTEEKLNQFLSGKIRSLNFRGVMSYYPVVTDIEQLAQLTGSRILYILKQTLRLRESLWATQGIPALPGPVHDSIDKLDRLGVVETPSGAPFNYAVPRFTLIHRALRLAISQRHYGSSKLCFAVLLGRLTLGRATPFLLSILQPKTL